MWIKSEGFLCSQASLDALLGSQRKLAELYRQLSEAQSRSAQVLRQVTQVDTAYQHVSCGCCTYLRELQLHNPEVKFSIQSRIQILPGREDSFLYEVLHAGHLYKKVFAEWERKEEGGKRWVGWGSKRGKEGRDCGWGEDAVEDCYEIKLLLKVRHLQQEKNCCCS